jgi:hypothetical protein
VPLQRQIRVDCSPIHFVVLDTGRSVDIVEHDVVFHHHLSVVMHRSLTTTVMGSMHDGTLGKELRLRLTCGQNLL